MAWINADIKTGILIVDIFISRFKNINDFRARKCIEDILNSTLYNPDS